MHSMKGTVKLVILFIFVLAISISLVVSVCAVGGDYSHLEMEEPNGLFRVEVLQDGNWVSAGAVAFDEFYREETVDLSAWETADGKLTTRITRDGGGAAHLDAVLLGGLAPASVDGTGEPGLAKLSQIDFDVIEVGSVGVVVDFTEAADKTLSLTGRIEAEVISDVPFQFPLTNLGKRMGDTSDFYFYEMDSCAGELAVDGNINEVAQKEPFFKEYVYPTTGHPPGYVYGWVMNDSRNLYVAMDFTADNTMDGEKDYAKVYVNTVDGLKEFKVSVPETTWGEPGFTYTDKVAYQHKVYEFSIPLSEIKEDSGRIQIAFAAYGTAAAGGSFDPEVAYSQGAGKYLSVYSNMDTEPTKGIYAEFVDSTGTPVASEITIYSGSSYSPAVAAGQNGTQDVFLAVWQSSAGIQGQIVNASTGALMGGTIAISDVTAGSKNSPAVAYDPDNQRFLVVWDDTRNDATTRIDVYGQFVNASGTLYYPGTTTGNFAISNQVSNQYEPAVAFDSTADKYMVVWTDNRNIIVEIYGQAVNADGSLSGTASDVNFGVSAIDGSGSFSSAIAFDSTNYHFLVVWEDSRTGLGSNDIYGQFVTSSGVEGSEIPICTDGEQQDNPDVVYNAADQRFLVAWRDMGVKPTHIYGQWVNAASGAMYGNDFVVDDAYSVDCSVSLAYNPTGENCLAAYEVYGTIYDIEYNVVESPAVSQASTDYRFAGIGSQITQAGSGWINPSNITNADTASAYTVVYVGSGSYYLRGSNFGFSESMFPSGSTISGIEVVIGRTQTGSGTVRDNVVKLVDITGTIVGENRAQVETDWPVCLSGIFSQKDFVEATYGGPTDLWGLSSLDVADITDSDFGAVLSVVNASTTESATPWVDYMKIRVYYTAPALPTYTVTYDGNGNTGGTVPVDSSAYYEGDTVTVLGNTGSLEKSGYTFDGWNTASDGSGTGYAGGDTFLMGAANVTLYAQWTALPTYTVTYDGNGNTGGTVPVDSSAYYESDTVTVLGNTGSLEKSGYTFDGWNTASDGSGTSYAGGDTFFMGSSNVTLYAQWTESANVTITYVARTGGSVNPTSETLASVTGEAQGSTATANAGYIFVNWTDASDDIVSTDTHFVPEKVDGLNVAAIYYANFGKVGKTKGPSKPDKTPGNSGRRR